MRKRRLVRAGQLLILVLAALAVALPLILRPSVGTRPASPRPAVVDSNGPAETEPPPAEEPVPYQPEPTTPGPARDEAPASTTDRRHVSQGPPAPGADATSRPAAAGRNSEWDRSDEARQRGVQQFGGTPLTEGAVESGLAWLAAHQAEDGTWDRLHFDRRCPRDDRCTGVALQRETDDLTAGVTGLALLAFLGAGYTDRAGPYPEVVRSAVDALLRRQEPHGGFSQGDSMAGYNDALGTLALAEYLALTQDDRVRAPLARAVARIVANQQARGGWDYVRSPTSGRNDTSITAWMVQALHACAAAGVAVPAETLVRAAMHFTQATEPDGRVRYADAGAGYELDATLHPVYRYGVGMLAAGLTCEQLLGWRQDGTTPLLQCALLASELPSAARARGRDATGAHNEYYWYYGTLAMFQRGGDDWERWNARLRDAILPLQDRSKTKSGKKRHTYGSWPPYGASWGQFGRMGGRVYTTAICTLTLEIYYRHTPAFLAGELHFTADDWRMHLRARTPRDRLALVACLAQLRVEVCEPVLVDLLADPERPVALAAAEALAMIDSPMGVALIDDVITMLPPWERAGLERALARGKAVAALPSVEGEVRMFDARAGLATLELPRSYVGMPVRVLRGDDLIAQMQVIQRFTGRNVVVAQLVSDRRATPQRGDRVVGP